MPAANKLRFSDTTASVLLDALRGIAAVLVLIEHWHMAFFVDYPQIPGHRILFAPMYLLCGTGHQAVIVFFVLSGYLISGSVFRSFERRQWNWAQYLTHRLVRLWIVLLPALVLGAFWDHTGIHLGQAPALYSGASGSPLTPDVRQALSLPVFMGNVAFLETILVPVYGSSVVLWSLANEFWYYILFPLAACILARVYKRPAQVVACGVLFCLVAVFMTKDILALFPVWLLGVLLHALPRRPIGLWPRIAASAVYAGVYFGSAALYHLGWQTVTADWTLGVATAGFVWVSLGAVGEAGQTLATRLSRAAARFSYTLYAVHVPILVFLTSIVVHDKRWIPSAGSFPPALGVLALILAYAWLLASATEFRTDKVRAWAESKIMNSRGEALLSRNPAA